MTNGRPQDLSKYIPALSKTARQLLQPDKLITDKLRLTGSEARGGVTDAVPIAAADVSERRTAVLDVVEELKKQVAEVLERRAGSERNAERLLIMGGVIVLCLPVALTVSNLLGLTTNWISTLFNGLSTAGFAALMFGPGREIRQAAKDRTALLLLPLGYQARAAAATTDEELRTVASDLENTLRGLAITTP